MYSQPVVENEEMKESSVSSVIDSKNEEVLESISNESSDEKTLTIFSAEKSEKKRRRSSRKGSLFFSRRNLGLGFAKAQEITR